MDDEPECPECEAGLPAWLATFADLMSLLMCFFVLLLSFATMDATRFKKMAESMKDAFGVQREVPAYDIVMGTSVIKTEFSPSSVSDPSLIDEVRQQTTDVEKQHLDVEEAKAAMAEQVQKELEQQAEELKEELKEEISEGLVNVETEAGRVIIRIQEKGSFSSGRASLNADFYGVMTRIGDAVAKSPGKVVVAGHTDDVPISTTRFRSNWELSSARAVTVVHALLRNSAIDPARILVEGHADSHPLVPNDSHESRSKNRRVELIIKRGEDADSGETLDTGASKG
ncbi:MAG: flagellar motor protein MotB [Sedimenticola sp.]